jgi:ABC-type multidrug transport system ATPase subunit
VRAVLASLASSGIALLVSSRTAGDVAPPFERVLVLAEGTVRFDGAIADFLSRPHLDATVQALALWDQVRECR